jgi:hypothetical protein
MPKNSIADTLQSSKVMLAGLKANGERMARRGIDTNFLTKYEMVYHKTLRIDDEHEASKARLKEKTSELYTMLDEMKKFYWEARKMAKAEMPPESWNEFGIYDQR